MLTSLLDDIGAIQSNASDVGVSGAGVSASGAGVGASGADAGNATTTNGDNSSIRSQKFIQ
jgi:hypothetical protein